MTTLGLWQLRLEPGTPGTATEHSSQDDTSAGNLRTSVYNLPPDIRNFVDRRREIASTSRIVRRRASSRSGAGVTIAFFGMPGVGKTVLALYLAHRLKVNFGDIVIYVNLKGVDPIPESPERVLSRILVQVGVTQLSGDESTDELVTRYRTAMLDRRAVVVLDNAAASSQVGPLLPSTPGSVTLVTSRRHLADLNQASHFHIEPMDMANSKRLIAAHLGEGTMAAQGPVVEQLVEACGRLPLALAVAGARLQTNPSWDTTTMVLEFDHLISSLEDLQIGERSVKAAFQLSYDNLPREDAQVFQRVSVAPGKDFGIHVAAACANVSDIGDVRRSLRRLADAQLLIPVGGDRYVFHDLLRMFAAEVLLDSEGDAGHRAAMRRYLSFQVALLQRNADIENIDLARYAREPARRSRIVNAMPEPAVQALVKQELLNTASCIDAAAVAGLRRDAWRVAVLVAQLLKIQSYTRESVSALAVALGLATEMRDNEAQALARAFMGDSLRLQSKTKLAVSHLETAIAGLRGSAISKRDHAEALLLLGHAYRDEFRLHLAIECYRHSADELSELGNAPQRARALAEVGVTTMLTGGVAEAIEALESAWVFFGAQTDPQRRHDRRRASWVQQHLGSARRQQGLFDDAKARHTRALGLFEDLRDRHGAGYALLGLADCSLMMGDSIDMRGLLQQARLSFETLDHRRGLVLVALFDGLLRNREGDRRGATSQISSTLTEGERALGQGYGPLYIARALVWFYGPTRAVEVWRELSGPLNEVADEVVTFPGSLEL